MKKVILLSLISACLFFQPLFAGNPIVRMETSMGDIIIELFEKKAPITVENFLNYTKDGYYTGTLFHRVINGFMIQGGGFSTGLVPKNTRGPIKNEASNGLKNDTGTIAMARTNVIDSATSQFFINVNDNSFLNHQNTSTSGYGYCVFGRVIEGMNVVNNIKSVTTVRFGVYEDVPKDEVIIKSVTVLRDVNSDDALEDENNKNVIE